MPTNPLLDELTWRGLLYQQTESLGGALDAGVVSGYCGFDPTASSLHVGNLVPVMGLVHLQRHGHRPIVLVGGGTGMIGDPSGKTAERQLRTAEEVDENTRAIRSQLEPFLDFDEAKGARMRDNAEWLRGLGAIEFMRDTGKHFTVNYMLQKESVKSRIDGGISFTEFSYMLLQAYDFLALKRSCGATLQLGGSDQWGNITAGIELIRRVDGSEAHALTHPLVTTSAGTKFGKTEAGAVWLDPERTTPYAFYQFWMRTEDADVGRFLRFFTLLPKRQIEELEHASAASPEQRIAQAALAREVTLRIHGQKGLDVAEEVTRFYFTDARASELSGSALETLWRETGAQAVAESVLLASTPTKSLDTAQLFASSGLASSKSNARTLLQQGAASINRIKLSPEQSTVAAEYLAGRYLILGKGKRNFAVLRIDPEG
ncbi:MAG: Tyrosyl-tRNA synthetase [Gemmatimonadetes bacterium]|nr:Tyrosyl-tRNA synthetase [Gemmatimonadota bacterium]